MLLPATDPHLDPWPAPHSFHTLERRRASWQTLERRPASERPQPQSVKERKSLKDFSANKMDFSGLCLITTTKASAAGLKGLHEILTFTANDICSVTLLPLANIIRFFKVPLLIFELHITLNHKDLNLHINITNYTAGFSLFTLLNAPPKNQSQILS